MSADTFDYVLSKVHDSLEYQTTFTDSSASTYMNHMRPLYTLVVPSGSTGMSNM